MTSAIRTPVKLLDLQAQYRPLRAEILAAITRVCDSLQFILGPEVEALERELAACTGAAHAIAVSSGTDALLAALMALGQYEAARGDFQRALRMDPNLTDAKDNLARLPK